MPAALSRALGLLALALLAFAVTAPDALAHGGRMKPPPEEKDVPPWEDPEWVPPAPDINPPEPGSTPPPPPPQGGITPHPYQPTGPARPNGPTTPSGRTRPRTGVVAWETEWQTWWAVNQWAYMPDRHAGAIAGGDITPTVGDGVDVMDARTKWKALQRIVVDSQLVPYFVSVLESESALSDEVRSSALIALAKVAQDERALEIALRWAEDERASLVVRESAALAVGLLRRSDSERQLPAAKLDAARERLLVLVDDRRAPIRTRAFAALSVGLLADQPYATPFTKDGRLTTRAIWSRLEATHSRPDIPSALLDALGMQPAVGIPTAIKDGLRDIAMGKRALGRRWDDVERAHAVGALARIGGHACEAALVRIATWWRAPRMVQRAACLALGARADRMDAEERMRAMDAALKAVAEARDPLSRGLATIAVGRLAGADLRAGSARMALRGEVERVLMKQAKSGPPNVRGFGALAIGLAMHGVRPDDKDVAAFLARARRFLTTSYEKSRGGAKVQAAVAVGLGLGRVEKASPLLGETVADKNQDPVLRAHAALSLGMFGRRSPEVLEPLEAALWDRRSEELPSRAALALSMLSHHDESDLLVEALDKAGTERLSAQLALAVGQMGDLGAIPALIRAARDKDRSSISRAMAIASLGLLADPEPRPSLTRLSIDATYPAVTDALQEVLTIL